MERARCSLPLVELRGGGVSGVLVGVRGGGLPGAGLVGAVVISQLRFARLGTFHSVHSRKFHVCCTNRTRAGCSHDRFS